MRYQKSIGVLAMLGFLPALAWSIEVKTVRTIDQIPNQSPDVGHYRLSLIDVATGLSILVQGNT